MRPVTTVGEAVRVVVVVGLLLSRAVDGVFLVAVVVARWLVEAAVPVTPVALTQVRLAHLTKRTNSVHYAFIATYILLRM